MFNLKAGNHEVILTSERYHQGRGRKRYCVGQDQCADREMYSSTAAMEKRDQVGVDERARYYEGSDDLMAS